MARYIFRGDAESREDIFRVTVNASIPGARYELKVWNRILASVTAVQGESLDGLTTRFRQAVEDVGLDVGPAGGNLFLISGTAGEALGPASDSSPGCYVQTLVTGVATTAQVFRIIMPVGASGGTWDMTFVIATSSYDTVSLNHNVSESTLAGEITAAANEVGGPGLSGVAVTLVNPGSSTQSRVYEVTMGGTFSGKNFTVTADGSTLLGTATVTCAPMQLAAASATAIQTVTIPLMLNPTNGRQQVVKFSRGGVTSGEVLCELATPQPTNFQAAVDAALATVLGENKVQAKIVAWEQDTPGVSYRGTGEIVIAIRWNDLGAQEPITAVYYSKQRNAYPGVNRPLSCQTRIIRESGANQNEFLLADVDQGGQPQNYEITQGVTTWTVNHNYTTTAAELVTQWEEGAGAGNVGITMLSNERVFYMVEFKGAKSNLDQPLPTFTTAAGRSFQVVSEGKPLQNQIDQVVIRAEGGTFTASSNGTNFTSALAYNLTNSTLQTALRGLAAIGSGNCNVSGSGSSSDPFLVEYVSGLAATAMPQLVFNVASLQGGYDPEIFVITAGNPGVQQQDKITIDPNAISGTIRPMVGGVTGGSVAWNGTNTNWTTAIEAIPSMGVTVAGVVGGPFFVTYDTAGPRLMTLDQSLLVVSESTLFSLEQLQEATGPNHYNEPLNWSPQGVPGTDDTPVFMDSSSSLTEALRQRCTWTAETSTGDLRLGTDVDDCGDFCLGQKVRISTTGSFGTATLSGSGHTLSAATDYYVVSIDRFRRRMGISTSRSGATIELTSAGTGVHSVSVRWTKIEQRKSHSGNIGLSRRLGNGWEERPRYLVGETPIVEIGAGETGTGTSLCFLDLGTLAGQVDVWHSGRGQTGEQAVQLRTNSTSIDVRARGGELGMGTDDVDVVAGDLVAQTATVVLGRASFTSIDLTSCDHSFPQGVTVSGTTRIVQ